MLDINNRLFQELANNPPIWWKNLINDPDIYIDIRKDNYLNVYYNGGAIMRLKWGKGFRAAIHPKYIPFENEDKYHSFSFHENTVEIGKINVLQLNNFSKTALLKIKSRINKYQANDSEKGLQGKYVTKNQPDMNSKGFFLDTEYAQKGINDRMDLVWVDTGKKTIAFVELKKSSNSELLHSSEKFVLGQLTKYHSLIKREKTFLLEHFQKVFQIKNNIGVYPKGLPIDNLTDYTILEKPILLVGDCTQAWIDENISAINDRIKKVAFASVCMGPTNSNFWIPWKSSKNKFRLDS